MPEVVLQDYLEDINQLIEESRLGEAVRHCRAILEQYPRHIDTYRLLGKAYLEQGELQAASDVFHRVLSADPEDFIAHAGMAIVYKQQEQLKEAVWHMQRAFEMDPYNGAIREALKDLYSKQDGMPEGQLPLSRGALARLHVKGELYSQAIAELRELLEEDPTRVDLQALLAEALWRDGQRVDAVEVCQQLLEALPFCIKANAILGEVWMVTDRQDEAAEYIERVFDMTLPAHDVLEDDTPAGRLFLTEGAPEIPQQVLVEPLAGTDDVDMLGADSVWTLDFDMEEAELDNADPEWLEAMQSDESQASPAEDVEGETEDVVAGEKEWAEPDGRESEEPVADLTTSDEAYEADEWPEHLADTGSEEGEGSSTRWLRDSLGEFQGLGEAEDDETDWATWLDHEQESEEPEAVSQEQLFSEIEEEGMGATDEFGKGQDEMPEEEMPRQQDEQPVEEAGTESFDWLDELADAGEPAYSEQVFSDDPLSEDLFTEDAFAEDAFVEDASVEDASVEDAFAEGATSEDSAVEEAIEPGGDALPDWLMEDAGVVDDAGGAPDWLDTDQELEKESVDDSAARSGEDLPDWLNEDDDVPAEMTEASVDDDLSWLDDLAAGEGSAIEEPPTMTWPEDEADSAPAEAVDDVAMDDVPEDLDDAMAWLEQLAAQQGAPVDELPSLSAGSETPEEEVLDQMPADIGDAMDWLEELAGDEEVATAAEADAEILPLDVAEAGAAEEHELNWLEGLGGPLDAGDADFDVVEEPVTPVSAAALEEADEGGEGMDWLEGLGGPADFEESVVTGDVDDSESVEEAVTPVSATELEELDDEDSEALDWLDELVAEDVQQEEPAAMSDEMFEPDAEEMDAPAAEMSADEGDDEAPEDLDDALAWLEQLAARQGAPTDELPSLHSESAIVEDWVQEESEPVSEEEVAGEEVSDEDDLDWLEGLDDEGDLDDAWLDEITEMDEAEEQPQMDASEEGEPSAVVDEEADDVPEDMDEAMAWLEQLAARQGAPIDELPSLDEMALSSETSAGAMAEASAMEELDDIPDDPEEALAWLEALAEGETSVDEEAEAVEEPSTPAVPHDVVAARAEAEAILLHDEMDAAAAPSEEEIFDDIPEDPDEAMAWLEQLAARQGAPLDELPFVSEAAEEVETPDWIAQEAEMEARAAEAVEPQAPPGEMEPVELEAADAELPALEVESATEGDEAPPLAEADEEPLTEAEELMDDLTAELEFDDDQLGEAMPDWLGLGDEDAGVEDAFDWNEVEGDVAGWLQAEEEATQHEMVIPDVAAEIGELPSSEPATVEEAQVDVNQFEPAAEEAPVTEWEQPAVENERLATARQAVEMGDVDSAVAAYGELVESGEDLNLLISDLEGAVATQSESSRLRTVLGDAYMRNGQLQKALDAYRQALDSL